MNAYNAASSPLTGLTALEAKERLRLSGFNELPTSKKRSIFAIAFDVFREPMFLLLVSCGVLYLLLGDKGEALMLLIFVFIIIGITLYQERKTERALEALRDLSSPRALVIRDSAAIRIPGREVVRGDLCIISEGDRVPADGTILSAQNLSVDESLLTGESVPVSKVISSDGKDHAVRPGSENQTAVYSGTLVVSGKAIVRAYATGAETEIGKIGHALQSLEPEETLLKKETNLIVRRIALGGALLCVIVVVAYGLTRGNWLHGFLAAITLAMAILPEEFPVVLTIFFALGAWRIAQRGVLTRRIPAVEMLGSASVLCVDKTGTLTMNQMTVNHIAVGSQSLRHPLSQTDLPEEFHAVVEYAILASHRDPFDPMEKAFLRLGNEFLSDTEHIHADWELVQEYPLSPELLAMSEVWKSQDGRDFVIASKGAPEAIVDLCHLSGKEAAHIHKQVESMAQDGLRVLAVARALFSGPTLPGIQHDFPFSFVGLIGLADPLRPTVPAALEECRTAGIRVMMITGDHPMTAASIAKDAGLYRENSMITGGELESLSDAELRQKLPTLTVFARVIPEQKLRLVNALKEQGEIVAMTGDGVNDAPALKAAHIGIAMGKRGTDVAREASALVLVDDDFSSIVQAIRMGRRIFDNMHNAMRYIIAIHIPIAGLSLLPVLFRWPLLLLPVHVMFLELIIDPACSIIFEMEPEEKGIMLRPPRNPKVPMFRRRSVMASILIGCVILAVTFSIYATAIVNGLPEKQARAMTFVSLVVANLVLILSLRSQTRTVFESFHIKNRAVLWVIGGAALFLIVILSSSFLRALFLFDPLSPRCVALAVFLGLLTIIPLEIVKMIRSHSIRKRKRGT
ncbi:MAG: cation-translocating P-type ATPase [Candidatus Peregrinibacteria bacterium]